MEEGRLRHIYREENRKAGGGRKRKEETKWRKQRGREMGERANQNQPPNPSSLPSISPSCRPLSPSLPHSRPFSTPVHTSKVPSRCREAGKHRWDAGSLLRRLREPEAFTKHTKVRGVAALASASRSKKWAMWKATLDSFLSR